MAVVFTVTCPICDSAVCIWEGDGHVEIKQGSIVATGHMQSILSQRNHITPCWYFWLSYLSVWQVTNFQRWPLEKNTISRCTHEGRLSFRRCNACNRWKCWWCTRTSQGDPLSIGTNDLYKRNICLIVMWAIKRASVVYFQLPLWLYLNLPS